VLGLGLGLNAKRRVLNDLAAFVDLITFRQNKFDPDGALPRTVAVGRDGVHGQTRVNELRRRSRHIVAPLGGRILVIHHGEHGGWFLFWH
jgi:hypothetical protein